MFITLALYNNKKKRITRNILKVYQWVKGLYTTYCYLWKKEEKKDMKHTKWIKRNEIYERKKIDRPIMIKIYHKSFNTK